MLSIEECRGILGEKGKNLSDDEIKRIRGALTYLANKEIDKLLNVENNKDLKKVYNMDII